MVYFLGKSYLLHPEVCLLCQEMYPIFPWIILIIGWWIPTSSGWYWLEKQAHTFCHIVNSNFSVVALFFVKSSNMVGFCHVGFFHFKTTTQTKSMLLQTRQERNIDKHRPGFFLVFWLTPTLSTVMNLLMYTIILMLVLPCYWSVTSNPWFLCVLRYWWMRHFTLWEWCNLCGWTGWLHMSVHWPMAWHQLHRYTNINCTCICSIILESQSSVIAVLKYL